MNFTQLRAFHALATTGGFTKAAEFLHVSQPAVTTQLKALEETYGVALFHRRGHTLTLTDTGAALFESSKKVFRFLDESEEILTSESELLAGTLRLGSDNPFFIMDILSVYKARYPGIKLEVDLGSQSKIMTELNAYEIDVAVITQESISSEFFAQPLSPLALRLLLPLGHKWVDHGPVALSALKDEPLIMREQGSTTRKIFLERLAASGVEPRILMELNNQVAVREAVASGLGIGAELDGGLFDHKRLVLVPIANVAVSFKEYVVCRKDRRELHKVRAFFSVAREVAPYIAKMTGE